MLALPPKFLGGFHSPSQDLTSFWARVGLPAISSERQIIKTVDRNLCQPSGLIPSVAISALEFHRSTSSAGQSPLSPPPPRFRSSSRPRFLLSDLDSISPGRLVSLLHDLDLTAQLWWCPPRASLAENLLTPPTICYGGRAVAQ